MRPKTPNPKVETIPDEQVSRIAALEKKIPDWSSRLSELMYENIVRVRAIANLGIKDKSLRQEFIDKASLLLKSEGHAL